LESCSDGDRGIVLVNGIGQTGGIQLEEPVTVGTAPVIVKARVTASAGSSFSPSDPSSGWALVAYLYPLDLFGLLGFRMESGFNNQQIGYAAEWLFNEEESDESDEVIVWMLDGDDFDGWVREDHIADRRGYSGEGTPFLDSDSGPVEQELWLVITPDDPVTDANETAVSAHFVEDVEEGEEGEPSWSGVGCRGDECLITVLPGHALHIGATAATSVEHDATVVVTSLSATVEESLCPPP
jgi:hypothetical protein